jgi:hypothetical protein
LEGLWGLRGWGQPCYIRTFSRPRKMMGDVGILIWMILWNDTGESVSYPNHNIHKWYIYIDVGTPMDIDDRMIIQHYVGESSQEWFTSRLGLVALWPRSAPVMVATGLLKCWQFSANIPHIVSITSNMYKVAYKIHEFIIYLFIYTMYSSSIMCFPQILTSEPWQRQIV